MRLVLKRGIKKEKQTLLWAKTLVKEFAFSWKKVFAEGEDEATAYFSA